MVGQMQRKQLDSALARTGLHLLKVPVRAVPNVVVADTQHVHLAHSLATEAEHIHCRSGKRFVTLHSRSGRDFVME